MSEGLRPKASCIRQITSVYVTNCKVDMSDQPDMYAQRLRIHIAGKSQQLCENYNVTFPFRQELKPETS